MQDAATPLLVPWESFYVIVGSSGAALTGLQFVVIALIAESRRRITTTQIGAFATPTIVHFSAVLLVAAVLSAPWHTLSSAALLLIATGATGLGYSGVVTSRATRQANYRLVLEDWVWHIVLPLVAYATLLLGAIALVRDAIPSLFAIAAATVLLLFVGIHNAWDSVAFVTLQQVAAQEEKTAPTGATEQAE